MLFLNEVYRGLCNAYKLGLRWGNRSWTMTFIGLVYPRIVSSMLQCNKLNAMVKFIYPWITLPSGLKIFLINCQIKKPWINLLKNKLFISLDSWKLSSLTGGQYLCGKMLNNYYKWIQDSSFYSILCHSQ